MRVKNVRDKTPADLFTRFCSSSTIHGTFFIKESKTLVSKLVWSCIIFIGIGMSGWIIGKSFQSWKNNPIVTSVMQISIEDINFPSITVCHLESNNFGYVEQELNKLEDFTTYRVRKMLLVDIFKLIRKTYPSLDFTEDKKFSKDSLLHRFCNSSNNSAPKHFESFLRKKSMTNDSVRFDRLMINGFVDAVLMEKNVASIFEFRSAEKGFYDLSRFCDETSIKDFLFFQDIVLRFHGIKLSSFRFGTLLKWLYDHSSDFEERERIFRRYVPKEKRFFSSRFGNGGDNCTISISALIEVLSGDEKAHSTQDCVSDSQGFSEDLSRVMLNSSHPTLSEIPVLRIPFCWYGEYEHRELTKNNTAYCKLLKESTISEDGNLCYTFNNNAKWEGLNQRKGEFEEEEEVQWKFKVAGCGKMKGLTVILDTHTLSRNWKDKSPRNGRMFKIFITEPGAVTSKVPFVIDTKMYGEHFFYIHGIHNIVASDEFIRADQKTRSCNFPHENERVTQFKSYNQANCRLECKLYNVSNICGCAPWFIKQTKLPVCDYSEDKRECFRKNLEYFVDGKCPCPSDCEMIHFFSSLRSEKFLIEEDFNRSEWIDPKEGRLWNYLLDPQNLYSNDLTRRLMKLSQNINSDKELVLERFKTDISILHFFFDTPVITQIKREMRLTIFDQISSIGGTLGLCTGVSIISFFEVVYWIIKIFGSQGRKAIKKVSKNQTVQINECFIKGNDEGTHINQKFH